MEFILVILLCVTFAFIYHQKSRQLNIAVSEIKKANQTAATIELENGYLLKNQLKEVEKRYQNSIKKERLIWGKKEKELKETNKVLQSRIRNRGEVITYDILKGIKSHLLIQSIIDERDFIILNNVFIPYIKDEVTLAKQVDHIIISSRGIDIIETKHWKGTIFHGLSKKTNSGMNLLFEPFFENNKNNYEHTFVITKENNKLCKIVEYDNPSTQAIDCAKVVHSFVSSEFCNLKPIKAIIFYNHLEKKLLNYSKLEHTNVFESSKELTDYFLKKFEEAPVEFNLSEIEKIKAIIKEVNYQ